jgi:hypothetical protein
VIPWCSRPVQLMHLLSLLSLSAFRSRILRGCTEDNSPHGGHYRTRFMHRLG